MADPLLDTGDLGQAHVAQLLATEPVLGLGTVSGSGRPHSVPVWFHWDDPALTVFSRPGTAKLAHLAGNDLVSFSLDSAASGADIVLGDGRARLVPQDDVTSSLVGFEQKYAEMRGGQTLEDWLATFSQAVLVQVDRLIAWTVGPSGLDYRTFRGS